MPFRPERRTEQRSPSFWTPGEGLAWVAGLVFALSSFMGWYSGSSEGITISVLGWNTGLLGKLVLAVGLTVLALLAFRAAGFELPAGMPIGVVLSALGAFGTTVVLIRLIEIPDDFTGSGRSIGIWISLAAALLLIAAGLLKTSEDV